MPSAMTDRSPRGDLRVSETRGSRSWWQRDAHRVREERRSAAQIQAGVRGVHAADIAILDEMTRPHFGAIHAGCEGGEVGRSGLMVTDT